jgi:hypothetical protein
MVRYINYYSNIGNYLEIVKNSVIFLWTYEPQYQSITELHGDRKFFGTVKISDTHLPLDFFPKSSALVILCFQGFVGVAKYLQHRHFVWSLQRSTG